MGCPKTAPEIINQLCSLHYLPSETGHCCKYFKVCNQHFERWMKEEPEAQRIHNEWLRLSNPEYCEKCEKLMTNADRIRAMSDEELEKCIIQSSFCPASVQKESCYHSDDDSECSECIKKWLRSEVQ